VRALFLFVNCRTEPLVPKCPPKTATTKKKHQKPTRNPQKNLCTSAKRQGGECAQKKNLRKKKNILLGAVILNPGSTPRNGASERQVQEENG